MDGYAVGEVAALAGVTVRTLHHYDRIGLVRPHGRTHAGYREYADADVARLHDVLAYRELGFRLERIGELLDGEAHRAAHLREQHRLIGERIARLHQVLTHLETMMEAEQMGINLTPQEQLEVFGPGWSGQDHAAEAEQRWGETDAWQQSRRRTARFSKQDWVDVKAEQDGVEAEFAQALADGLAAGDARTMDVAERHRRVIARFYECSYSMHRALADLYLADPRFTQHYEDVAPGLAQFVHDAIHHNADRQVG
jgi:DNA-binding transcriptional MerR regulator